MAVFLSNSYPSEFNFIENPIIVHAGTFNFAAGSTFRQLVIKVTVSPMYTGASVSEYFFYADASAADDVSIDISSALRAAMKGWEPDETQISTSEAGSYEYEYAVFNTEIWEKYLLDGETVETTPTAKGSAYAFYGGLSNYDLWVNPSHVADRYGTLTFSRKPSSLELRAKGDLIIKTAFPTTGANIKSEITIDTSSLLSQDETRQFLFVNSFGVFEVATAFCRESLSYTIESELKTLAAAPTYFARPNRTTHKTGGRAAFRMSSGILDREWAVWWATEFLMAKRYWMKHGTAWLPVVITPADEEVLIYNAAENGLCHVDFNVEVALETPPLL